MTTSTVPEVVDLRGRVASNLRATSLADAPAVTVAPAISALASVPPRSRRASSTRESWPGLLGPEHGDGGHPAGLLLVATSSGGLAPVDVMPQHVPLSAVGDSHVGVQVCGADLYLRVGGRSEVAEPLRIPFGPAARAGYLDRCLNVEATSLSVRSRPPRSAGAHPVPVASPPACYRRLHQGCRCFRCAHTHEDRGP